MNVEVTKLPESKVTLSVELTPQEVDSAIDRTYKQLVQRVNIPGFRRGKAPRAVVERMVGPEAFLHEATDEAVRWGYRQAVDQADVTPIDEAEIDLGGDHEHVQPSQPFSFTATVGVKPEVQLPDYAALKVERPAVEVPEADVESLLMELREREATLEPVVRPAQMSDVLTMNLTGKVDGNEVLNDENFEFELRDESEDGPVSMLPGLSPELVGANRGDIRELVLSLPDTYPDGELAGKTMFVRALIKEIKRKALPALDDEFAHTISQYETLDEVREALRANLLVERRLEADEKLVSEAVEAVTGRSFVEIPPVLIEEELDRMIDDLQRAFDSRHLSFEQYLQGTGKTVEEIRDEMRESAVRNVKTSLVLGAVADREGIEVSNREVDANLEEVLRSMRSTEAERRRIRSSTAVRGNIRTRLRRQRTIQRLVEIMTGGAEVPAEATEAVTEQTVAVAEDTQETVAVEIGG